MGTLSKTGDDLVFRLAGEVEGVHREFILAPGDHRVGSLSENEIDIQASDVSRRHAVIHVNAENVHIEDLKSTNGTFVNGVQVTRSDLALDDWIQFGSVLLTLERVDCGDLTLGIELDSESPTRKTDAEKTEHTTQLGKTRDRYARWLALANEVSARLLRRDGREVPNALEHLRQGLGATGAAVLQMGRGDRTIVHVATGDTAALEEMRIERALARMRISETGDFSGNFLSDPLPMIVIAKKRGRYDHDALVVCGGDLDDDLVPVFELVFRIMIHIAPIERTTMPSEAIAEPLAIPENHVQGHSAVSQRMYEQIAALRNSTAPILIIGETGVGKEHVVQILHASSNCAKGPLRVINCAAIPADLLEAELFGIEAGVATGVDRRPGAFREAVGGTLFFDEIGAMPLSLQAKLLRALQENEVHPVGARKPVPVDVRIVAATNSDLACQIEQGSFRSDLYYRIAGCEVAVAPIRHRHEDIPALTNFFLEAFAAEAGKPIRGLSVKAMTVLQNASWPGNIRQLEHEIRRLVSVCPHGAAIESSMISPEIAIALSADDEVHTGDFHLKSHVDTLERRLIRRAVGRADGNLAKAARLLGLSRNGLVMKIERLGIENG